MDNPATTAALTARGYALPEGSQAPQTRLDEAWRALQREVPSIVTSLTTGWVTAEDVVDAVAAAALRVLRNPDGVVQADGAIDDYREGRRYADATQDVYFTAAEVRRLSPPTATAGSIKYS